ncbi:MAG TPA: 3-deoxy-D-manno-octulosonic acid transferase [Candidatus Angelobacter sp.]|nr:3-deoxy-D-manno-octulosonic acid transferase [Candidatus Angelobacter sp.]
MYIVYSLLLACALLVSLPWWLFQLVRLGKYRAGLAERLGFVPPRLRAQIKSGSIWIHAVSVGEVLAVSRLITELQAANPHTPVFVSTTTATGQKLARERFGDSQVFYAPLDFGFAVRAYLHVLKPTLLVLAETEFWPNLLRRSREGGAALAIVNARVSDRSFPRYSRFRWFFARVLAGVDLFLAQTKDDAARLRAIGAPAERVEVSGNLKFDVRDSAGSPLQESLRQAIGKGSRVIVCGSTSEGEEQMLLAAFAQILKAYPSAVMVLAPRHPERFDAVARLVSESGLPLLRRSTWSQPTQPGPALAPVGGSVFLLDSIGELASVYALADVAFVGGSLLPGTGGHNILEPAQHGVPILVGPNTFNFREIVKIFEHGSALAVVSESNLAQQLNRLLADPAARQKMGARARELFVENSGATARTLHALESLLRRRALKV